MFEGAGKNLQKSHPASGGDFQPPANMCPKRTQKRNQDCALGASAFDRPFQAQVITAVQHLENCACGFGMAQPCP